MSASHSDRAEALADYIAKLHERVLVLEAAVRKLLRTAQDTATEVLDDDPSMVHVCRVSEESTDE